MLVHLLSLLILLTLPQQEPKRFQCKVIVEGEQIQLTQCQYEDEQDMVEGYLEWADDAIPKKWRPSLLQAVSGEATAHFEETAKEVCLRQVRPLDGFIRHPANEDLNLCQRKGKGWKR